LWAIPPRRQHAVQGNHRERRSIQDKLSIGTIIGQGALYRKYTRSSLIVVKPKRSSVMMHLKTMAKLFAVSIVILTGSPAFAARTVHHNAHCLSCEQKAPKSNALRRTGGDTRHDDWPAGMILG
jgi:hypothetical protein